MAKGKKREVPAEEKALTESFVRLVKRMGPKRAPSANVRRSLLYQLLKKDSEKQICGLIEWYMHTKRRTWEDDVDRGQRWAEAVSAWVEENRPFISAIVIAKTA
jgi:hypothetical protein